MATGRRAFQGTTAASLIGAILHTDPPPVSTLQPLTPRGLDRVVSRCLAKDPEDRWQTARDLVLELNWVADHATDPVERKTTTKKRVNQLGAALLAALAIGAGAFTLGHYLRPRAAETAVRLTFSPPAGLARAEVRTAGPVTISPDGLRVVYVAAGSDGEPRLWVQPLDSIEAQALAGTDGAAYPFWSPDSRSIAFFANGRLMRIDASGGPPQHLCDASLPRGGTWGRAGVIVFSANAGEHLYQVSSAGGTPTVLTFTRPNRESHWPSFLPDGRHFVYFGRRKEPGVYVASLDPDFATKLLVKGLYAGAAYASSGYLMLVKGGAMAGTLLAQPIRFRSPRADGRACAARPACSLLPVLRPRGLFGVGERPAGFRNPCRGPRRWSGSIDRAISLLTFREHRATRDRPCHPTERQSEPTASIQ